MVVDSETQKLLEFIRDQWIELPDGLQPEKVWVCFFKPIKQDVDMNIETSIQRAWFLDDHGFQERNVNEFSRFAAAHLDVPWHVGEFQLPSPRSPIFSGHTFEFGLVSFAKYQNSDSFYLQFRWGKLHGRGYVVQLEAEKFIITREHWKS
jgi:hypothetical protein